MDQKVVLKEMIRERRLHMLRGTQQKAADNEEPGCSVDE